MLAASVHSGAASEWHNRFSRAGWLRYFLQAGCVLVIAFGYSNWS